MKEPLAEAVIGRPGHDLRAFIDRYVGYRLVGFPAGIHRGLPSRHLTFIVSIGPAIEVVAHPREVQSPARYRCVLGGLQDAQALIRHGGSQEGVAIELTPLGLRALVGMPAGALWNQSLELSELVGPAGAEMWERLQSVGSWRERFAVCDEVLGRMARASDAAGAAPPLQRCWQLLARSSGLESVASLAAGVGWSRQHLTRRFRDEFGTSPQTVGRILRFERARRLLEARPDMPRVEVALACGFFDQPHFNREFAHFAGCAPSRWLAGEVPSIQDERTMDEGDSPHEHNNTPSHRLADTHLP